MNSVDSVRIPAQAFCQRKMKPLFDRERERWLVKGIAAKTAEIAEYVVSHFDAIAPVRKQDEGFKRIVFHVNAPLLLKVLKQIEKDEAAREQLEILPKHIQQVRQFIDLWKDKTIPLKDIENGDPNSKTRLTHSLEIAYLQGTGRFTYLPLPLQLQEISCFDYVVLKLDMQDLFVEYLNKEKWGVCARLLSCLKLGSLAEIENEDYIQFFLSSGYEVVSPEQGLKPNDVLLYFSKHGELTHAALVAEDPQCAYAKLGNLTPYAYKHHVEETPGYYGPNMLILRGLPADESFFFPDF